MRLIRWVLAAGLLLVACAGTSTPSTPSTSTSSTPIAAHPCNPLAGGQPVTLGTIVGVGRAPDGRVYVVDEVMRTHWRAFIATGTILERQHTSGAALAGDDKASLMLGADLSTVLWLHLANGIATEMGLVVDAAPATALSSFGAGQPLALLGPKDIAGLTAENVEPPEVLWDVVSDDGAQHVVVLQPTAGEIEDRTLFYGTAGHMEQRPITGQGTSLGPTEFHFHIDGADAVAALPPSAGSESVLTLPNAPTIPLHDAASTPTGQGLTYFCE